MTVREDCEIPRRVECDDRSRDNGLMFVPAFAVPERRAILNCSQPRNCLFSSPRPTSSAITISHARSDLLLEARATLPVSFPNMAEDSLPSPDLDEMTLTNRGLAALYIQYPDMEELPGDESAIVSDTESEEEAETSGLSISTTQTTPPRIAAQDAALRLVSSSCEGPFPCFLQRLADCGLPAQSSDYLTGLGYAILELGRALFAPTGPESVTTQVLGEALAVSRALTAVLKRSCTKVNAQIDNIAYILTLAPFTVHPEPADLWANYKQMADLILE